MRSVFDQQLELLNQELSTMGALCETAISSAAKVLLEGGENYAAQALETDSQIDQKERDIETLCLKMLLRQQPVAKDLRKISAAMKMITDMERIGDQAADIAEILSMDNIAPTKDNFHVAEMARATIKMVTDSIEAYVHQDAEMARGVIAEDDIVDGLFTQVKNDLIQMIQKGGNGETAIDLLMIAKYFERIGDHATNIAEWVLFSLTGNH